MHILKLILKNAVRHKLRSFLTVLGIAVAITAFTLLQTVLSAWYVGVEASGANRLVCRHAVSLIFPLPLAYADRIQGVHGVEKVTYADWFGGVYVDKRQFFARMAVSDNFLDIYPELNIPQDQRDAYLRERNACIVGTKLVERYNFKIGDIIPLEGDIYPGKWEFVVRGIYTPKDKVTDPSNMFFHWNYIDERMKQEWPERAGYVGWYAIRIKDPAEAGTVSKAIDDLFANSPAETKTETERAFSQGFLASAGAILAAINIVSFVIIGIIVLVLGNTMIMSARERVHEYAVLKTLGFSGFHLGGLIAGESLVISLAGTILGVLVAVPATNGFAEMLPKGWFPIFSIQATTLVLAAAAALLVGVAAALFPMQRALRTSIVDGLRQIG